MFIEHTITDTYKYNIQIQYLETLNSYKAVDFPMRINRVIINSLSNNLWKKGMIRKRKENQVRSNGMLKYTKENKSGPINLTEMRSVRIKRSFNYP